MYAEFILFLADTESEDSASEATLHHSSAQRTLDLCEVWNTHRSVRAEDVILGVSRTVCCIRRDSYRPVMEDIRGLDILSSSFCGILEGDSPSQERGGFLKGFKS